MNWNEDKWQNGEAEHPNYIVKSDNVAVPFFDLVYANAWKNKLCKCNTEVSILDLTKYDWVANPAHIKFHKLNKEKNYGKI